MRTLLLVLRTKNQDDLLQHFLYHARRAAAAAGRSSELQATVQRAVEQGTAQQPEWGSLFVALRLMVLDAPFRAIVDDVQGLVRAMVQAPEDESKGKGVSEEPLRTQAARMTRARAQMSASEEDEGETSRAPVDRSALAYRASTTSLQADEARRSRADSGYFDVVVIDKGESRMRMEPTVNEEVQDKDMTKVDKKEEGKAKGDVDTQHILQLKKLIDRMNTKASYREAIGAVATLVHAWQQPVAGVVTATPPPGLAWDVNAREAQREFRMLLEAFAGGASMDPLLRSIDAAMAHVQQDDQVSAWFRRAQDYVQQLFQRRAYLVHDQSTTRGVELLRAGRGFLKHPYRGLYERVLDEWRAFTDAMRRDQLTQRLVHDVVRVHAGLLLDDQGTVVLKRGLVNDVRNVLLPLVVEQVQFVPLPRILYTDSKWDVALDNVIITAQHVVPAQVEVAVTNDFVWRPQQQQAQQGARVHVVDITLSQMQANVRDVDFYVKHKTFPRTSDRGKAHLVIGGQGVTVRVRMEARTDSQMSAYDEAAQTQLKLFQRKRVDVMVDKVALRIARSRRDTLYRMAIPLLLPLVRTRLETAIQQRVTELLDGMDTRLNGVMEHWSTDTTRSIPLHQQVWSIVRGSVQNPAQTN
jgi:hypothetical protein